MAFLCIPIDPAACTPSSVYPQSVPITQVTSPEGLGPRRGKLTTITVLFFRERGRKGKAFCILSY